MITDAEINILPEPLRLKWKEVISVYEEIQLEIVNQPLTEENDVFFHDISKPVMTVIGISNLGWDSNLQVIAEAESKLNIAEQKLEEFREILDGRPKDTEQTGIDKQQFHTLNSRVIGLGHYIENGTSLLPLLHASMQHFMRYFANDLKTIFPDTSGKVIPSLQEFFEALEKELGIDKPKAPQTPPRGR